MKAPRKRSLFAVQGWVYVLPVGTMLTSREDEE
jgi:hypothetical protein